MWIGSLASNASLAEYFVTALGLADHAVTLYSARQDLFSPLAAAASLQGEAPHEVLLLKLIVDASRRQTLAGLSGLAREPGLCIIVLSTALSLTLIGQREKKRREQEKEIVSPKRK